MSASVNKTIHVGYAGDTPKAKVTESGHRLASFYIATTQYWESPSGEKKENTEWLKIVAWGKLADRVEKHVRKGTQVYCEGRIETRKYIDQKSGQKLTAYSIVAQHVLLLGKRPQAEPAAAEQDEFEPPMEGPPPRESDCEAEFDPEGRPA